MGSSPSKQIIQNVFDQSYTSENIFNQITQNTQRVNASSTNVQNMKIKTGDITNCDATFLQSINSKTSSTGVITAELTNKLYTSVTSNLLNTANNALHNTTGFGSTSGQNIQETYDKIKTAVSDITKRTLTLTNLQEISASSYNSQTEELNLGNVDCTLKGNLNFSQDSISSTISYGVTKDLLNNLMNDTVLNSAINSFKNDITNTSKGFFESLFGSLSDLFKSNKTFFIICCIVILLLIVVGIYLKMKKGQGGENTRQIILNKGNNN